MQPSRCATEGLTLTELLVVVAIVALLAAMLFPILGWARESAVSAECKSRLRQIGQAFNIDIDSFPNAASWPQNPYETFPREEIYRCPRDEFDPNMPTMDDFWYQASPEYTNQRLKFSPGNYAVYVSRGEGYTQYIFEEEDVPALPWRFQSWYPAGPDRSDNDGVFRVYDGFNSKSRTVRLEYYTCHVDNRAYVGSRPMFGEDASLLNFVGQELRIESFYTSYGMPRAVNGPGVAPDAAILVDYERPEGKFGFVVDEGEDLSGSARHGGRVNVLRADLGVVSERPK